jgi:trans-aconitate methyltransferase
MAHEFDGKKYQKASIHQKEWGDKIISEFNLTGNENILDLGCGDGSLTLTLANLVPNGKVVGIDASEGMISVAKEKSQRNLTFYQIDINDLKLNDKFDLIFSNATLHWIKDHSKLWHFMKSSLNPLGGIRFNFAGDGNCSHFFKVIQEVISSEKYSHYFEEFIWPWYMPTLADYTNLISKFSEFDAKVWDENADRFFPDKGAIIGWIDQPSIVPFLKYIPELEKNSFRESAIKMMLNETLQPDGRYFETFRRINVSAKLRILGN